MSDKYKIELTKDEAVVLFEFLSRFTQDDKLEIKNQSENRVLWDILSRLEEDMTEPLELNYKEILAQAQERLKI